LKKIAVFLFIIFLLCGTTVSAAGYKGYIYNNDNKPIPSQIGYIPQTQIFLNNCQNPSDMFLREETLYVLDSDPAKIIAYDLQFNLIKTIEIQGLEEPTGIFADSSHNLFVADPAAGAVVKTDPNGKILMKISKESLKNVDDDFVFKPQKVICDSTGLIYIAAQSFYQGALTFDQNGQPQGFFGSNTVDISLKLLNDMFWKKILSKDQVSKMSKYVPEEFTNFHIDSEDMVYTCTQNSSVWKDRVKKLNPVGINIMKENNGFGELESIIVNEQAVTSQLIDVTTDKNGFISVFDYTRGRIYQYDGNGQLLLIFGGSGNMAGSFLKPAALLSHDDKLLALDREKCSITVFEKTQFGKTLHEAVIKYNEGKYSEAVEYFQNVLKQDGNYELAYTGIGKALYEQGDYKQAAEYFKKGSSRELNSEAFLEYRNQEIKRLLPVMIAALVLLAVLIILIKRRRKKA